MILKTQELNPTQKGGCPNGRGPDSRKWPKSKESISREHKETLRLILMSLEVLDRAQHMCLLSQVRARARTREGRDEVEMSSY